MVLQVWPTWDQTGLHVAYELNTLDTSALRTSTKALYMPLKAKKPVTVTLSIITSLLADTYCRSYKKWSQFELL